MANWADLPLDSAIKISQHIDFYEDLQTFAKVCSCWRQGVREGANISQSSSSKQTPWLMLAEPSRPTSRRRFYSLYSRKVLPINLPTPPVDDANENWTYLSSNGWLFSVTQKSLKITLFDPFNSNVVVQLPDLPLLEGVKEDLEDWHDQLYCHMFHKFVVSKKPSKNNSQDDDYCVAMIFGLQNYLAFWSCGDDHWTLMEESVLSNEVFFDVNFCNGEFYAVDQFGKVMALGEGKAPVIPRLVANLQFEYTAPDKTYLVESAGEELLLIRRDTDVADDKHRTTRFRVWELNVSNRNIREVNDLGDRAVFVGLNSAFSVEASPPDGCKPNCIYYTDDSEFFLGRGMDVGIYDLATKSKIEDYYDGPSRFNLCTQSLWVQCPHSFSSNC